MKYKKFIIGITLGGVLGYAYYHFIGCSDGTCSITSSPVNSALYGMLMGGVLFFPSKKKQIVDLENKIIIDVRSYDEFIRGHIEGSKNIPLSDISNSIEEIKAFEKPIIVCCATGMRSAKANSILLKVGIESENGGSWTNVDRQIKS